MMRPLRKQVYTYPGTEVDGHLDENATEAAIASGLSMYQTQTSTGAGEDSYNLGGLRKCLIDPYSTFMQFWDVFLIIGLLYTSVVTPFDAAFLELDVGSTIFQFNIAVDLLFFLDIVVTFVLPYQDAVRGTWVTEHSRIAWKYLKTWFLIDLVSVFPFDWILFLVVGEGDSASGARALRLLKLLKIARIFRGSRIYARWKDRISVNLTRLSLVFYLCFTLVMAHWVACLLGVMPVFEGDFTSADGGLLANWQIAYFEGSLGLGPGEYGVWDVYLASLYWSIMTLTTIGFGDIRPVTNPERAIVCVLMLAGASLQAYLIGTICGLLAELDWAKTEFRGQLNSLNEFMSLHGLPDDLRVRLRRYFAYKNMVKDSNQYKRLLLEMSPALQSVVTVHVFEEWLSKVPFVQMADPSEKRQFTFSLAMKLRIEVFSNMERILSVGDQVTSLYIVSKGSVLLHVRDKVEDADIEGAKMPEKGARHPVRVRGSVSESVREELFHGECFGHELIYANTESLYNATTLQFTELHVLDKLSLEKVLIKCPKTKEIIEDYGNGFKK